MVRQSVMGGAKTASWEGGGPPGSKRKGTAAGGVQDSRQPGQVTEALDVSIGTREIGSAWMPTWYAHFSIGRVRDVCGGSRVDLSTAGR